MAVKKERKRFSLVIYSYLKEGSFAPVKEEKNNF